MSQRRAPSSSLQPITVFVSPGSLTFHATGKAKQMQASIEMQAGLFSEYQVLDSGNENWEAGGEFCVNLTTLLECLHALGTQNLEKTKVNLSYNLSTAIFKVELLEESGVLSTAAIGGLETPEDDQIGNSLALAFRSSPVAARIIVKSDSLRDLMRELEIVAGATVATLLLGDDGLEMTAVGHWGECCVTLPSKGGHVVSVDVSVRQRNANSYPLHSFLGSMKRGLDIAQETCITVNTEGMVAIQHQVIDDQVGDGNPNFVDFILCALVEEDDEATDDPSESVVVARSQKQTQESPSVSMSYSTAQRGYSHSRSGVSHDSSDEEDEEPQPSEPTPNLFESVLVDDEAKESPEIPSRRVRRRYEESPAAQSVDMMAETDDEEDELHVASTPPRVNRDDECSSPELVYGKQR